MLMFCLSTMLAFCASAACAQPPNEAAMINFVITDHLSSGQQHEEITVSINNLPIGTLRVAPDHPHDSLTVKVKAAATYHYDLCGQLDLQASGPAPLHKIDDGGDFTALDGDELQVNNSLSSIFFLVGTKPGRFINSTNLIKGQSCRKTVAWN